MDQKEAIKRNPHYRCTRCNQVSPLTAIECSNPSCRAQLVLYGTVVTGEEAPPPPRPEPPRPEPPRPEPPRPEPPRPEPPRPEPPRPEPPRPEPPKPEPPKPELYGYPFIGKHTLLCWLQGLFALLYITGVILSAYWARYDYPGEVVFACLAVLPLTVLSILLLQKQRFVFSGILTLIQGLVLFSILAAMFSSDDEYVFMILTWGVAYLWVAILSFIRAPIKRVQGSTAEMPSATPFISKTAVLVNLNILIALISFWCYPVYIFNFTFMHVLIVLVLFAGIILAACKQYVVYGVVYCLYSAFRLVGTITCFDEPPLLFANAALTAIYIFMAVISFKKGD